VVWSYFAEGATTTIDGTSDDVGPFSLRLPFSFTEVTCVWNTMPSLMVNTWYMSLPKSPLERIHLANVPCVLSIFAPVLANDMFAFVPGIPIACLQLVYFLRKPHLPSSRTAEEDDELALRGRDRNHDNFCRARSEYE